VQQPPQPQLIPATLNLVARRKLLKGQSVPSNDRAFAEQEFSRRNIQEGYESSEQHDHQKKMQVLLEEDKKWREMLEERNKQLRDFKLRQDQEKQRIVREQRMKLAMEEENRLQRNIEQRKLRLIAIEDKLRRGEQELEELKISAERCLKVRIAEERRREQARQQKGIYNPSKTETAWSNPSEERNYVRKLQMDMVHVRKHKNPRQRRA
jgi:hypothetical protein